MVLLACLPPAERRSRLKTQNASSPERFSICTSLVKNDLQSCVSMKDVLCLNRFSIRDAFWGRRNHLMGMIVPTPSPGNNYARSKQSYLPNPHSPMRPHKTPLGPTRSHNHPAKTPNDPTTTQHDSTLHHTTPSHMTPNNHHHLFHP